MLFFGKMADIFGYKIQLCAGTSFLALVSFGMFWAHNPVLMIVLCAFLGLGTAVITPPAVGAIMATYPEGRRRNKVTGALGAGNPIGFIVGSMSAGASSEIYGWRAPFLTLSVIFTLMCALCLWALPKIPASGNTMTELKRFDWLGTFLTVGAMALVCTGLTFVQPLGYIFHKLTILQRRTTTRMGLNQSNFITGRRSSLHRTLC